ncbi:Spo11/DNA topoisomerase VI subunit A [Coemansia spiralis]|nr:Spo11/DNA topoisomerase VI subunit A [Coemansia spiralis]
MHLQHSSTSWSLSASSDGSSTFYSSTNSTFDTSDHAWEEINSSYLESDISGNSNSKISGLNSSWSDLEEQTCADSSFDSICKYDALLTANTEVVAIKEQPTFGESNLILSMRTLLDDVASEQKSLDALTNLILGPAPNRKEEASRRKGLEIYCLLEIAFRLLSTGQIAYQRDIYYRHKSLLKSTENVRALCCKIAFFLDVPPAQLNIISCPKGRMYGNLSIELIDGSTLDYSQDFAHGLPHVSLSATVYDRLLIPTAFFALIQSGFGQKFPWVVLVTGKGYPDINTREILSLFATKLPVSVLVDYDPDGANIFKVYALQLPHACWAGMHCTMVRIGKWGLDLDIMTEFSVRDRKLALQLIENWKNSVFRRRRMAKMLYRGKKAELEMITQFRAMLVDYIQHIILDSMISQS